MFRLSNELIEDLRSVLDGIKDVEFAALFGSVASRRASYHDIDLAVKVRRNGKYRTLCRVVEGASRILNIPEEYVDVVDLDRADLDLRKEVAVNGIVLVDRANYMRGLIDEVNAKYIEYSEIKERSLKEWLSLADPSSIDLSIVKRRIDFAKEEIQFLEENVLSHNMVEVSRSPILMRLLERSFQLITEAILDACRHIVSVKGWGPALSYSDLVRLCSEHKVISGKLKEELLNVTRLRNIIVHRYLKIDYEGLYEESRKLKGIVRDFEKQILELIRRELR
jgi:uncharacterized protein YutE (UPF0331/DUF86 family)/predicted nucleotidyltransferase